MEPELTTDEDTNRFFDRVVSKLQSDMGFSEAKAIALVREFYSKFTDEEYCKSLGIALHDDDLFFHDGIAGAALKIYYYLELNEDPNPAKFQEWKIRNNG